MPTVRTTMQPDREIEVGDADYLDLKRQGLLVDEDEPAPLPQTATATPSTPEKKTTTTAKPS
jgi:hypothetical protein